MEISNIKCTNMDLTDAIRAYVEEKMLSLAKFAQHFEPAVTLDIEVGKTTGHHNKGEVFKAECNLQIPGHLLRAESVGDDLYAAIDACQSDLKRQLEQVREKLIDRKHHPRPGKE
ncbi:MAG: sigma 54 modulation protein/ribosomal protein S30EA [uncultured bacterium]|nr:MAG: sigma 54 modulation protein/ribosomal protein S30EA [uncultured bacterium]HBD05706.1 ribosome-associated translation inhibitor RaiA [Candidatus Uhrbacteria bacterium]